MSKNTNLNKAKKAKNDEFYTQLTDIEKELQYYTAELNGKIVYCNCDDYTKSNFVKYFKDNFNQLGLKGLVSTGYNMQGNGSFFYFDGNNELTTILQGNGSYNSPECLSLLKQVDVVITNPPFSLFRDYVDTLMQHKKKFLIVGSLNALTYKNIFGYIKAGDMELGCQRLKTYEIPIDLEVKKSFIENNKKYVKLGNTHWFTNMQTSYKPKPMTLSATYKGNEHKYPKYDNYDAINVDKVKDIPIDYNGVMGVPITFFEKIRDGFIVQGNQIYNVLGITNSGEKNIGIRDTTSTHGRPLVNNSELYLRVPINPHQSYNVLGTQRWNKDQCVIDAYKGTEEDCINDNKVLIQGTETYSRIFIKPK